MEVITKIAELLKVLGFDNLAKDVKSQKTTPLEAVQFARRYVPTDSDRGQILKTAAQVL